MNKATLLGAAGAGLFAASAFGQSGIVNSAHNFSGFGWADNEICKPCHTPHHADPYNELPEAFRLWNHKLTTATYQVHGDGSNGDGTGTAENDLDFVSRLCLSCHDGTVALDAFGGAAGGSNFVVGRNLIGTDLVDDHPVAGSEGIYYSHTDPDRPSWWNGAFVDVNAGFSPSVGSGAVTLPLEPWTDTGGVARDVVSCATCHEVHNRYGHDDLLRIDNNASGLCLTCHIK